VQPLRVDYQGISLQADDGEVQYES